MNEEMTHYQGVTKRGRHFSIRSVQLGDEIKMAEYINTLSNEKTFITFQGEQMSVEDEKAYVEGQLKKIAEHKAVLLLAFSGHKLIGISGIDMKDRVSSHVGIFGLSISKEFRNEGIGRVLSEKVIEIAVENIPHLRIITLGVFSNNQPAIALYESLGFTQFANLPEGVLHRGEYIDYREMYKVVRKTA